MVRATSIVTAPYDEWWDFSIHDFYDFNPSVLCCGVQWHGGASASMIHSYIIRYSACGVECSGAGGLQHHDSFMNYTLQCMWSRVQWHAGASAFMILL